MKICFFIWGMSAAGAERVMSFLASTWASRGWQVTILTMQDKSVKPFYPLDPRVDLQPLNLLKGSSSIAAGLVSNINRLRVIRNAIKDVRPDVLISFLDTGNILAILATRCLRIPVVISERTNPSRRTIGFAWRMLRNFAYPLADVIVFQSKQVMDWFPGNARNRGIVIPNPVPAPPPEPAPRTFRDGGRAILAMGRLASVKGFDLLLRAFAEANVKVPGWTLDIWGEGPEDAPLKELAESLAITESVRFRGVTSDPFEVMRSADLFVLPSRAEGFPNALTEAMACGLPVISADFGGAARDIIQDGINGVLVPPEDPSALADALIRLMTDREERVRLAAQAPLIVQRFSSESVLAQWESTLVRITGSLS